MFSDNSLLPRVGEPPSLYTVLLVVLKAHIPKKDRVGVGLRGVLLAISALHVDIALVQMVIPGY